MAGGKQKEKKEPEAKTVPGPKKNVAAPKSSPQNMVIPASEARAVADASASNGNHMQKPSMPEATADIKAAGIVKDIVAWASPKLLDLACAGGFGHSNITSLAHLPPLQFEAAEAQKAASTYKETWHIGNCKRSLSAESLYEAGGSLFWMDMFTSWNEVSWQQVLRACSLLDPKPMTESRFRITWPFTLETACLQGEQPDEHYPRSLTLLHGHCVIFSWWKLVYDALDKDDRNSLTLLLECALTPTVQLRVVDGEAASVAASISAASKTKELEVIAEHFWVFAVKLAAVVEALPKQQKSSQSKMLTALQEKYKTDLRYQGSQLNKTMLSAALAIAAAFPLDGKGQRLLNLLADWYGKMLTSYSTLYKLANIIKDMLKETKNAVSVEDTAMELLLHLMYDLKAEHVLPREISDEFLFGAKSGVGWVQVAFVRMLALRFIANVAVAASASQSLVSAFGTLSPGGDGAAFKPTDTNTLVESMEETVQNAKKAIPQKEVAILEIFNQVLCGEHLVDFKTFASETSGDHEKIVKMLADDRESKFGKALLEACRSLDDSVVSTEDQAPIVSVRKLARCVSNEDPLEAERAARAKQERDSIWKKAVDIRSKTCEIIVWPKCSSAQDVCTHLVQSRRQSTLELNAKHRGVFLSADLVGEPSPPWSSGSLRADALQKLKIFAQGMAKLGQRESEFHFHFDGKSRDSRKILEEAMAGQQATESCELWISFDKSGVFQVGGSREVFGADLSREICLMRLPCSRVRLACNSRSDNFSKTEKSTTSDCTYSEVPHISVIQLPKISKDDKEAIMGYKTDVPESWAQESVPLFWGESKAVDFFQVLLKNYAITDVQDLSVGCGSLAVACLKEGVTYQGFVGHKKHKVFIENILNLNAAKLISQKDSCLFQQSLSEALMAYFEDDLKMDES